MVGSFFVCINDIVQYNAKTRIYSRIEINMVGIES